MPKLTFSMDDATVEALRKAATRSGKPQSLIVREAIAHYTAQEDRLSETDRTRLLDVLQRIRERPTKRTGVDVDRELRELRRSRRTGWSHRAR